MNSGFWLNATIMASGVVFAALLLPNRIRTAQVEREVSAPARDDVSEPVPVGVRAGS